MMNIDNLIEQRESAVRAALAVVYTTFGRYGAPKRLNDAVPWHIDEDVNRDMCTLPLRDLKRRHFWEYNIENQYEVQPAEEIKYFLPRMLELVVHREEINHAPELYLQRLGQCGPNALSLAERAVLEDFAVAFFAWALEQWPDQDRPVLPYGNAFTILLMWDIAGLDVSPLLSHWLSHEGAAPTLHYVEAVYWDYLKTGRRVDMVFSEDRPLFQEKLSNWLELAENRVRFSERIRALTADKDWGSRPQDFPNRGIDCRMAVVLNAITEKMNFQNREKT